MSGAMSEPRLIFQWMCIPFAMLNPIVGSLRDVEHDWIGHVDGKDIPSYIDYGLLLIFGGIPWQVSSRSESTTPISNRCKVCLSGSTPTKEGPSMTSMWFQGDGQLGLNLPRLLLPAGVLPARALQQDGLASAAAVLRGGHRLLSHGNPTRHDRRHRQGDP